MWSFPHPCSLHGDRVMGKRIKKNLTPYGYLAPTIVLMVLLLVLPICMVVFYSFQKNAIVVKNLDFTGLKNYQKTLEDEEFITAVKNTVYFVIVSVIAHLGLGLLFASLLNSRQFGIRTKSFFRIIYILPWVFTASVIAILWKLMLQPQGIINYLLSFTHVIGKNFEWLSDRKIALYVITFVNIWSGYPFYMISILAGLQGIPADLYESAVLDGANGRQQFWYITLTELKPILISIAMLDFIWTLQSFNVIWMLTAGGPVNSTETLSIYIYKLAFNSSQYGLASAAAVLVLIVCVILAVFYVRQQRKASA